MLRDGRYFPEPRPVIGKFYDKKAKFHGTYEEVFIQSVLLNNYPTREPMLLRVVRFLIGR